MPYLRRAYATHFPHLHRGALNPRVLVYRTLDLRPHLASLIEEAVNSLPETLEQGADVLLAGRRQLARIVHFVLHAGPDAQPRVWVGINLFEEIAGTNDPVFDYKRKQLRLKSKVRYCTIREVLRLCHVMHLCKLTDGMCQLHAAERQREAYITHSRSLPWVMCSTFWG